MAIVSEELVGQHNPRGSQGPLGQSVEEAEPVPWTNHGSHWPKPGASSFYSTGSDGMRPQYSAPKKGIANRAATTKHDPA